MSISIGNNLYSNVNATSASTSGEKLQKTLSGDMSKATDQDLMDACKSFESYFVEMVVKEMRKTVPKSEEDENEYNEYFGDMLYEKYAEEISKSGSLGIADMLYNSMQRK